MTIIHRLAGLAILLSLCTCALAQISINPLTGSPPGLSQDLAQVGSGNLTVTIRGGGFTANSKVRLGNTDLTTTVIDSNTLMGTIPPGLIKSIGTLAVTVVDGSQTSNAVNLKIVIRGDVNASGTLNIGDALVVARSAGGLVQPPLPPGVGDVNLNGGLNIGDALVTALFAGGVLTNLATPTITSTNVMGSVNGEDAIVINGMGISSNAADNIVFFSKADGTFVSATASSATNSGVGSIMVTVPSGAVSGPIFLKRKDLGLPGQPFGLSIGSVASPLYISKITPTTGLSGGATLTLNGTGFSTTAADNLVTFSAANNTTVTASPSSAAATSLTVTLPGTAVSGFVLVTVGSTNSNKKSILVSGTPTPLLINHVYYSDLPGEPVLIDGTGFNVGTPSDNQVVFTTSANTEVSGTVVMAGRTELIALVPNGAATGSLKVKTNGGQNVSNSFNFTAATGTTGGPFNGRIEYSYDVLNRLTEVRYPNTIIRYAYDPAGNRTSMVVVPR